MVRISVADVGLVMVGGYDVKSEDCFELSVEYENVIEQTDGADDDNPIWRDVGMQKGECSMVGIFNDAALKNNAMLRAGIGGGARAAMFGVDVIGSRFFGMLVEQVNFERKMELAALTKAAASYHGTASGPGEGGADHDGRVVHAHTQEVGVSGDTESTSVDGGTQAAAVTITSSSVDDPTVITTATAHGLVTGDVVLIAGHSGSTPSINGSHVVTVLTTTTFTIPVAVTTGGTGGTSTRTSSRGGAGYLEASQIALGGYTSVTVKLRHSVDDITYADLATFTVLTVSPTSERAEIVGSINRYVASSYVFNGAGTAQSVTFAAGVVRNE